MQEPFKNVTVWTFQNALRTDLRKVNGSCDVHNFYDNNWNVIATSATDSTVVWATPLTLNVLYDLAKSVRLEYSNCIYN